MTGVPEEIRRRRIAHFTGADLAYGKGVAKGLGLEVMRAAE